MKNTKCQTCGHDYDNDTIQSYYTELRGICKSCFDEIELEKDDNTDDIVCSNCQEDLTEREIKIGEGLCVQCIQEGDEEEMSRYRESLDEYDKDEECCDRNGLL